MIDRRRLLKLTALTGATAVAGGAGRIAAANALEVTHCLLPAVGAGRDFTMVLLADVHAPQPGLDVDALARLANAAEPDLVLIVGDSINRREDVGLLEMYSALEARVGKFATVGNWENWALVRRAALRNHYDRAGVYFLDNDSIELPELDLRIVGLDERTNGRPDWSLVGGTKAEGLNLVLHHSPGAFDLLPTAAAGTTLMLAGHTHGGQIAPLGRSIVLPPGSRGYVSGVYTRGRDLLYVSRGIGNSHVPLRIGSRPELAVLRVQRSGGPA